MSELWKRWEGQVVNGEFPLLRYLGAAEHSAVFLTERRGGAPHKAAIKLVRGDVDGADAELRRWQQYSDLNHPHLVRSFESGRCELDGVQFLFLVMEAAEEDLSQVLPERALTAEEARQLLPPVLDALGFIHGKGLVHGRLRPSNILADGDQVKVSADSLRASGEAVAAPRGVMDGYYPPEALNGQLTAASDVWSLAITLVEVLTQRRPTWDPENPTAPPVPAGVPEPFAEIARRSLKVDPQQRWTVEEISAALQGKPPTKAVPASPRTPVSAVAAARKEPTLSGYVLGLMGLLVVIALIVWAASKKGSSSPANPSTETQTQETGSADVRPVPEQSSGSARGRSGKANNGSVVQGAVLEQVMPRVSPSAMRTIQGRFNIVVRVKVDASGKVTGARIVSRGPSQYFARLSLEAAQEWKFRPAQVQNQAVASEWNLRFGFRRSGIDAVSAQIAP